MAIPVIPVHVARTYNLTDSKRDYRKKGELEVPGWWH